MSIVPKFLEGTAFGVLNDIISTYHTDEGYAQPNRFEVLVHPPARVASGGENQLKGQVQGIAAKEREKISIENIEDLSQNMNIKKYIQNIKNIS